MRQLTLREYQTAPDVELSRDELHGIQRLTSSIDIWPAEAGEDRWDLTPGSEVGGIQVGELAIEIQPKLPIDRLLFMLSYNLARQRRFPEDFGFIDRPRLVEAVLPAFAYQLRRALRRGMLQGYRSEEDALQTVRGRIRFDDQIRAHYGRMPPVEVRYDEFTEDITENRILKAALHRVGKLRIRSTETRRSLLAFELGFANVSTVEYHRSSIPQITFTRLNEHYRPAIELARLILRATSFETSHGEVIGSAFLVDMNQIFEDFVVIALREALSLSPASFPQGAAGRQIRLDRAGRIRLMPDISWWVAGACRFVGDVKYKKIRVDGVQHPDIYQLLAYTIATDLPAGMLIYAAGEADEVRHEIRHADKRLRVIPLHLSGTPEEILAEIAGIAGEIRELAALGRG